MGGYLVPGIIRYRTVQREGVVVVAVLFLPIAPRTDDALDTWMNVCVDRRNEIENRKPSCGSF